MKDSNVVSVTLKFHVNPDGEAAFITDKGAELLTVAESTHSGRVAVNGRVYNISCYKGNVTLNRWGSNRVAPKSADSATEVVA